MLGGASPPIADEARTEPSEPGVWERRRARLPAARHRIRHSQHFLPNTTRQRSSSQASAAHEKQPVESAELPVFVPPDGEKVVAPVEEFAEAVKAAVLEPEMM